MMPEYGRLIQKMAEHAVGIDDREERRRYAETIVRIMANHNPQNRNIPGFNQKLWGHLAAISNHKLDIDYPFPVGESHKAPRPEKLDYPQNKIRQRQYGHLIEKLLQDISKLPEGDDRDRLTVLAKAQMRKDLGQWNNGSPDDAKLQKDIEHYLNATHK